jgi:hypothetical protein
MLFFATGLFDFSDRKVLQLYIRPFVQHVLPLLARMKFA